MKHCFTIFNSCYRKQALDLHLGTGSSALVPHQLSACNVLQMLTLCVGRQQQFRKDHRRKEQYPSCSLAQKFTVCFISLHQCIQLRSRRFSTLQYFSQPKKCQRENEIKSHITYAWTMFSGKKGRSPSHGKARLMFMHFQWFSPPYVGSIKISHTRLDFCPSKPLNRLAVQNVDCGAL